MPRFPRSRLALSLALGLLLVALGGGAAFGAGNTTDSFWLVSPAAQRTIPASSCQGPHACDGATGKIGKNSCNGSHACFESSGDVGNGSCNGDSACIHSSADVGNDSCHWYHACLRETGSVGNHSCKGGASCWGSGALYVGNGSCNHACLFAKGTIGDQSCLGLEACFGFVGSIGHGSCHNDPANRYETCGDAAARVGNYACNGGSTCYATQTNVRDCARNVPGFEPSPCVATRSVIGSSEFPTVSNQPVDLWATVIARYPVVGKPGGRFQFRLDGQPLGSPVAIDSYGRARISLYLRPGIHWVTGRYQGDGTFSPSVPVARLYQLRAAAVGAIGSSQHHVPGIRVSRT